VHGYAALSLSVPARASARGMLRPQRKKFGHRQSLARCFTFDREQFSPGESGDQGRNGSLPLPCAIMRERGEFCELYTTSVDSSAAVPISCLPISSAPISLFRIDTPFAPRSGDLPSIHR